MSVYGDGGDIDLLARGLTSFSTGADTVRQLLRDLAIDAVAPPAAAGAVAAAIAQLERSLGALAAEVDDAAAVLARGATEGTS